MIQEFLSFGGALEDYNVTNHFEFLVLVIRDGIFFRTDFKFEQC